MNAFFCYVSLEFMLFIILCYLDYFNFVTFLFFKQDQVALQNKFAVALRVMSWFRVSVELTAFFFPLYVMHTHN